MRDLYASMLSALLDGEGLKGVVDLAAVEAGAPIAILLPARGLAAASDDTPELEGLSDYVSRRLEDPRRQLPERVEAELPVLIGDRTIGYALALAAEANGLPHLKVDRKEVLRFAAMAALTEVAVSDARDELAGELRGSLIEDLRSRSGSNAEIARRAARLGCDLSAGAVALVAEVRSARPRHTAALITGEHRGALAEGLTVEAGEAGEAGERPVRVYALLPAKGGEDSAARTLASARALVTRLRPHGPAAYSSFCGGPDDLDRAVAEAELMLEVISRDERMAEQLSDGIGNGVYRLLFRALASDPEEVQRFFSDTVEPLVAHDREYRTDLLGTLESYLGHDCNMNATARAVYAHRHTVAHRLTRIRELTGLDPGVGEDRERLGLGIKAYRILSRRCRSEAAGQAQLPPRASRRALSAAAWASASASSRRRLRSSASWRSDSRRASLAASRTSCWTCRRSRASTPFMLRSASSRALVSASSRRRCCSASSRRSSSALIRTSAASRARASSVSARCLSSEASTRIRSAASRRARSSASRASRSTS